MDTIGIIGSGKIGSAVARLALNAGLKVLISNSRGPESLGDLVTELGEGATATTGAEAATRADLVVLTIPYGAAPALPAAELTGKIVVDATNYMPQRDGHIPALLSGSQTSSAALQAALPGTTVVKTLNTVDFLRLARLPRPAGAAERTALPIASDDAGAKHAAADLLNVLGFDAVDAGTLADSWRFQPGTPSFFTPYFRPAEHEDPAMAYALGAAVPVPFKQVQALLDDAARG